MELVEKIVPSNVVLKVSGQISILFNYKQLVPSLPMKPTYHGRPIPTQKKTFVMDKMYSKSNTKKDIA